ncbi:MAG: hypothetical protein MJZ12_00075 [Prevotella sp.]|nr:hypothetical protein [Prevotella sp.]
MAKKIREFMMNKPAGTFYDVYELYKWLGAVDTSSAGHKFEIKVSIVETTEE